MTRFIYDQFSKDYLEELLSPLGQVQSDQRVAGEVRQIDVCFIPQLGSETQTEALGLLGRFASTPAFFEPFRNPATANEIGDCVIKLLLTQSEIQREAKRTRTKTIESTIPKLWILTPTVSLISFVRIWWDDRSRLGQRSLFNKSILIDAWFTPQLRAELFTRDRLQTAISTT
jgi:hypothetical protein